MSEGNKRKNSYEETGYMIENKITSDDIKIKQLGRHLEEGTMINQKIDSNKSTKSDKEIDSNCIQGLEYNHKSSK